MLMGGRAEGLACADPGAGTPIGMSENFINYSEHYLIPIFEINEDIFIIHISKLVLIFCNIIWREGY
jgi:hypothetical protein